MGVWSLYFIAKLFLYFGQYMGFHVWLNLGFAIFVSIPIPAARARLKLVRQVIAIPLGIALFYHDTWLPPISRAISQIPALEGFSMSYLAELAGRFISWPVVAGMLVLCLVYFLVRKKLRVSSFVYIAMLIPLMSVEQAKEPMQAIAASAPGNSTADTNSGSATATEASLDAQLSDFYRKESARSVAYTAPAATDAPFDIIILQICSLSWDDLDFTGQRDNPLFNRFNIVFTNFSSGSSYSGPAAIRLLRGSCGQTRHKDLYSPAPAQCMTFDDLQKIGFEPELAMNHNGKYGGFLDELRNQGGLKAPLFSTQDLPPYLQSFDGSTIHDDYAVLSKWWTERMKSNVRRVALFYNTISMHDGNYYEGHRSNSMKIYPARLKQLLGDIDHFFSELQASGRRAVVVVLAEHGASIRGDKMQIAGLREIPSPRISIVPAAIKLIGFPEKPDAKPILVTKPASYLAISQLLSDFITISPFGSNGLSLDDYVRDLPSTEFVAENEDVVVMRRGSQYFIHSKGEDWVEYDNSN